MNYNTMAFRREKSNVRFDTNVDYIEKRLPSIPPIKAPSKLNTQTSFLHSTQTSFLHSNGTHLTHEYVPKIHRQTTEVFPATPLRSALQHFSQTCLPNEFSATTKALALEELKEIVNKVTPSLSRNSLGLHFLPAVYAVGFSHWQTQPERRVVCYLPFKLPHVKVQHQTPEKVHLRMHRKFPSGINIQPSTLGSKQFVSSEKVYSIIHKLLERILVVKSIGSERLNFSSTFRILEISLQNSDGWIGEVVPCIVVTGNGNTDNNILYCCKPFCDEYANSSHQPSVHVQIQKSDQGHGDLLLTHGKPADISIMMSPAFPKSLTNSIEIKNEDEYSLRSRLDADNVTNNSDHLPKYDSDADTVSVRPETRNSKHSQADDAVDSRDEQLQPIRGRVETEPMNRVPDCADSEMAMEDPNDLSWYSCNPQSENVMVKTISKTDGGLRMTATMIVCKLALHDWRLLHMRCYDIQMAMFHDIEHRLDHSPRWQRDSLERCVHSLLSTLHKFTKRGGGRLPHFNISGVDLWRCWSDKQMTLVEGALGRLASSDTALVSLVCRTGDIRFENLV